MIDVSWQAVQKMWEFLLVKILSVSQLIIT